MTLWITLTFLTSLAAAIISIPIFRRYQMQDVGEDPSITVERDQLIELERDKDRGLIGEEEAAAAKAEIERRILIRAKSPDADFSSNTELGKTWALVIIVGWIVVGATGLYALIGRPDLPSRPFVVASNSVTPSKVTTPSKVQQPVTQANSAVSNVGDVDDMIAGLETRLAENPEDAEGWRMLGWSYFNTQRYGLAAQAYGKSVALDASDSAVLAAYGESLVRSEKGLVNEKALAVFDNVLALDALEPRARFFKGMALEQAGNSKAAIELWLNILDGAPANADWVSGLQQRVQELAVATGYDLGERFDAVGALTTNSTSLLPPKPEPGPTQEDVEAAQKMSPEDRQAMIIGMVDQLAERLEVDPDDAEGWAKLIRSRLVLGDKDAALIAYQRASKIFANQPIKLSQVTQVARQLGLASN